jgi:hypothetical protein
MATAEEGDQMHSLPVHKPVAPTKGTYQLLMMLAAGRRSPRMEDGKVKAQPAVRRRHLTCCMLQAFSYSPL